MSWGEMILAWLAIQSAGLNLWQWALAGRFMQRKPPLQSAVSTPITLFKPLKGIEPRTKECLRSWVEQRYDGDVQILFGIAQADDPAGEVVRELIASFPNRDLRLVICPERLGANAKVSTLIQLARQARHEVWIVSDADVFAPPELLHEIAAIFKGSATSLVNCFYRLDGARNIPMKLEALAMNADFWSQVLQSRALKPMDFALGAVMAVRREALQEIGGFQALVDYLADDYELGHRVARSGGAIELARTIVSCAAAPATAANVWRHQLRWARTIRVCQPVPYFLSVLANPTFWPLLWMLISQHSTSLWFFLAALSLRILSAGHNVARLAGDKRQAALGALAPLKDLLQIPLWASAFLGNRVLWRGETFRVLPNGKLLRSI